MDDEHANTLKSGQQLNDYVIESMLGEGGLAITYLARQAVIDKRFAIKEYLPREIARRTSDGFVTAISKKDRMDYVYGLDRFIKEAKMLARFRHPNIVQVQGFFEAGGTAYMVMDYEKGDSFGDLLRRNDFLTEAELRAILFPLLDGLAGVHKAGVLHRDIKPGNIYIRGDGVPVLLDFGAARHALEQRAAA